MPRPRPPDRLDDLVRAATNVFIAQGYRRTQVGDIAEALGVAKGTVYTYVESKEALFDLVLRQADRPEPLPLPAKLPVSAPPTEATLRFVAERLKTEGRLPKLEAAVARRRVADAETEVAEVVSELFDTLARNRTGIKLIDRCAADYPDLADLFQSVSRDAVPGLLERWIRARVKRGHFRAFEDTAVAARMVMELCVTWSVHIHWDPSPIEYPADALRDTAIHFTKGALLA